MSDYCPLSVWENIRDEPLLCDRNQKANFADHKVKKLISKKRNTEQISKLVFGKRFSHSV